MIILAVIFGAFYLLRSLKENKWRFAKEPQCLFVLLAFAFFFEFQLIVLNNGTAPYVSMLPTYILLLVFAEQIKDRLYFAAPVYIFLSALFLAQFVYSPLKYFFFYKNHGTPLALHAAENIQVSPYQKKMYGDITEYIQNNTEQSERIVVADYNSMFALLSQRKDLFSENWMIFGGTSFHPYNNQATPPNMKTLFREREIVERIEKGNPKLILIPNRYLESPNKVFSPFLEYIKSKWEKVKVFEEGGMTVGIDYDLGVSVFTKKS